MAGAVESTDPSSECSWYDTKPSDGKVPVLKLWVIWSTPSLSLLSGPLWSGVDEPDRVLSMSHIELFDIWTVCKQLTNAKLNC